MSRAPAVASVQLLASAHFECGKIKFFLMLTFKCPPIKFFPLLTFKRLPIKLPQPKSRHLVWP